MVDYIAPRAFFQLGALAGFPAVGPIAAGEAAWSAFTFTAPSTPPGRLAVLAQLAPWWTAELLATPAAEARLRTWYDLARPTPSRRVVARDLVILGLDRLRQTLVMALRRMPPPVVHHVLHRVWLIGVGRGLGAWMWQSPPVPAGPLQLIALDGKLDASEVISLLAHEVSHAWLTATASVATVSTVRERVNHARHVQHLAGAWRLTHTLVRDEMRSERQAAALARSWGFVGAAANPDACAEIARLAAMRGCDGDRAGHLRRACGRRSGSR